MSVAEFAAHLAALREREAALRARAQRGAGESGGAWRAARKTAGRIQALRAGKLEKRSLAQFLAHVDRLCELVASEAGREDAWDEHARCAVALTRLVRDRQEALRAEQDRVRDLLRLGLIDRDEAVKILEAS